MVSVGLWFIAVASLEQETEVAPHSRETSQ